MEYNPFKSMIDMMKEIGEKPMLNLDKDTLLKNHQQNLEALSEANRMALDVMKSIAKLQSQYLKQSFEDMSQLVRETMAQPLNQTFNNPEAWKRGSQGVQEHLTKAFQHSANVNDILAKSQQEIFKRMQQRYEEGSAEIINVAKKPKTKH